MATRRKKANAVGVSSLLIQEEPLQVLPSLAVAIGLNEAIFLQQLHYWLRHSKNEKDGKIWVYNTFEEWQGQMPWWSTRTIMRIVDKLRRRGLIETSAKYNRVAIDKTLWYTINYDSALKIPLPGVDDMTSCHIEHDKLSSSNCQLVMSSMTDCQPLDDNLSSPITRDYTETTTETTTNDDDDDDDGFSVLVKVDGRDRADREAIRKTDPEWVGVRLAANLMVADTLGASSWDGWEAYRDSLTTHQLRLLCYWCQKINIAYLSDGDEAITNPVGLVRHGVDKNLAPALRPIDEETIDKFIQAQIEGAPESEYDE